MNNVWLYGDNDQGYYYDLHVAKLNKLWYLKFVTFNI